LRQKELAEMVAKIYRRSQSATQAGPAKARAWVLEYDLEEPRRIEPLMGWTASGDMLSQVRLCFESKEAAVAYANRQKLAFRLEKPNPARRIIQSYADNFRSARPAQWTH
jgi:hypothetical protein